MTEIKEAKPGSSPTKGTPEGRRLRDLAIQKALQEVQSQKDSKKTNLVWISDDEGDDDDFGLDKLKLEGSDDLDNGVLQKHIAGHRQWPNSSVYYYESPLTASLAASKSSIPISPPSTPTRRSIHSAKTPSHVPKAISKEPPSSPSPSSPTPRRRGKFNAYVVYSGNRPYFYDSWSQVAALQVKNPELVFKGFSDLGKAQAAYKAAKTSGVIDALQKGEGQKFWVVMEGFKPGVYFSGYDALRDGLKWGGGFVTPFAEEIEADEYWNRQVNADRIVNLPDPGYVD